MSLVKKVMILIGLVLSVKEYRQNLKFKKVYMFNNPIRNRGRSLVPVLGDKVCFLLLSLACFHLGRTAQLNRMHVYFQKLLQNKQTSLQKNLDNLS